MSNLWKWFSQSCIRLILLILASFIFSYELYTNTLDEFSRYLLATFFLIEAIDFIIQLIKKITNKTAN